MFEPNSKSSSYLKGMFVKRDKVRVINKAFHSLSFRGMNGYPPFPLNKSYKERCIKQKTYGAILRIRDKSGIELYGLVQGRYTGKWSFPKGHSNYGEEPIECMLREVWEETGIKNLPDPLEYLQIGYGNYFVFNLEEEIELIPIDKNEIIDTKWVTLEEMERMSLNADVSVYRKKLKEVSK